MGSSVGAGGTTNVTGFVYDNLTGIATVTSVGHGVTTGDIVELERNCIYVSWR